VTDVSERARPLSRRDALALGLAAATGPVIARSLDTTLCIAYDNAAGQSHVALLRVRADRPRAEVVATVEVPTRAHGLLHRADGSVLAVARRPGDWLLHWQPQQGRHTLHWNDTARRFNGHIAQRGGHVFTTETDLADGQGCIVVRDARGLGERAVWPTHGRDPHDLAFDVQGRLWVANGGIATDPATGRAKDVRAMDSSLVCLDARSGALQGQWRLDDARLSLRHLALRADGPIGIALQAEHDDADARAAAPVLALWHGGLLRAIDGPPLAGYGGDIAVQGDAFIVSAPRAGRVAAWRALDGWRDVAVLPQACALASTSAGVWCGGGDMLRGIAAHTPPSASVWAVPSGWRLDNHAVVVTASH
jgi:hypothetical protein